MNLYRDCTKNEIKSLKNMEIKVEDREYTPKEIEGVAVRIEEYVMSNSSKNEYINNARSEFSNFWEKAKRII